VKLPANFPAFEVDGEIFEGRPSGYAFGDTDCDCSGITLINPDTGFQAAVIPVDGSHFDSSFIGDPKLNVNTTLDAIKPLTRAARKLVAWVRQ
jgi:hypothetical protein